MKHIVIAVLFITTFGNIFSQKATNHEIANQIDEQVWIPFTESYSTRDAIRFNSLHTDDVLRITKNGILKGDEYKNRNLRWLSKSNQPRRTINFRFEHRIHSENIAYAVGYYKVVNDGPNGEDDMSCGRFNVVLKKMDGIWELAQDWDTDVVNGVDVTLGNFERLEVWEK